MNSLLQFLCLLSISLLVLDSCGDARQSPFISDKDSSAFLEKKSQHLEKSKLHSATVLDVSHPKKTEVKKYIRSESNGGGVTDPKRKKIVRNLMEEEEALGREMIEHIDYAGATTHPPSEPPKKKKTSSNQKGLHPPSRAH
ncbi:hypothetical protein SUGI_0031520 [Cryptomeria japonica]|uniref:uncharacterized protein LOC131034183 n=1 Tax=Cryptomeria japonica TaxID=3369 RepID=UPI002408F08D|nr:uncharacterized protein LOC131034183 [Cryptomeria japonica]GLJ06083.1 hypothetical protein SUGI_0031520 [Cryptomeria japonica]